MTEDIKPTDENEPPADETVQSEEASKQEEQVESEPVEEVKEDRPEINYRKEAERKSRELEKIRAELETERSRQINRYDPNDLKTWSDNDLKAVKASQDPNFLRFKDQAEDILLERKVERMRAAEIAKEKRVRSEIELRAKYPEALDPSSPFSTRLDEVMMEFDLDKTPAGRLAAATIVAGEMRRASAKSKAIGRKSEDIRISSVKANLSDGDRPKSVSASDIEAQRDLEKRAKTGDADAFQKLLLNRLRPQK